MINKRELCKQRIKRINPLLKQAYLDEEQKAFEHYTALQLKEVSDYNNGRNAYSNENNR